MRFKHLKKFKKANRGAHAIELLIVTPIWIFVIFLLGYLSVVSADRQDLANESTAISNIISISKDEEDMKNRIDNYFSLNNIDSNKIRYEIVKARQFLVTEKEVDKEFVPYESVRDSLVWRSGVEMMVKITMDTSFKGSEILRFNLFGEVCYLLQQEISNTLLITLNGEGAA